MHIRELGTDDIAEIRSVFLGIFTGEPWNDCWEDPAQCHQYIVELTENRNSLSFGFYEGNRLIGISLGRVKHWYAGTEYWIDEFGILPQHQGRGAGTEFLSMIAQRLKSRGIVGMVLLTEREMPACRFYIQNGFETREEQVFLVKML